MSGAATGQDRIGAPPQVPLEIGGIRATVQCDDSDYLGLIRHRYEGFQATGRSLSGSRDDAFDLLLAVQDDLLPGSEVTPRVDAEGDGYRLRRRDFDVILDQGGRRLQGTVARSMYSFDSMLRVFFTLILQDADGMLIHGSSIVERGRAVLFYGVSGSGKTTTTLLSAPRPVLSDELTLVRKVDGEYRAYGTPFWGELQKNGENISAPLDRVLLLRKDTRVFVEPMTPARALRALMPCVLFFAEEPAQVQRVVDRVIDLVADVPAGALHFRKDPSFWDIL